MRRKLENLLIVTCNSISKALEYKYRSRGFSNQSIFLDIFSQHFLKADASKGPGRQVQCRGSTILATTLEETKDVMTFGSP